MSLIATAGAVKTIQIIQAVAPMVASLVGGICIGGGNYFGQKQNRLMNKKNTEERKYFDQAMQERRLEHDATMKKLSMEHDIFMADKRFDQNLELEIKRLGLNAYQYNITHFWPFKVSPEAVRNQQVIDGKIALRVFMLPNEPAKDKIFATKIFPMIETDLSKYVSDYQNIYGSKNIIYYSGAVKDGFYGTAAIENYKWLMKGLPTLVISSDCINGVASIWATAWGSNESLSKHICLFEYDYKSKSENEIANELSARIKYVLGSVYDGYNFLTYNQTPILPEILNSKKQKELDSSPLKCADVNEAYKNEYLALFQNALASADKNDIPLQMYNFANSLRDFITNDEWIACLDNSVETWVWQYIKQNEQEQTTEEFLNYLINNPDKCKKDISISDREYIQDICEDYSENLNKGKYGQLCIELLSILKKIDLPAEVEEKNKPSDVNNNNNLSGEKKDLGFLKR